MALTPGTTLGPYTVTAELGHGGMGVVYQARDPRLDRHVAIKLLPPDLTRDKTAKQRFLREAKAASALDHPNICTIFEINETDDGQLYLVMAHYEGETLTERVGGGHWQEVDSTIHFRSLKMIGENPFRSDPPIEPMQASSQWFVSDPTAIEGDHVDDAVLMVRLGLAVNALNAQQMCMRRVSAGSHTTDAVAMRDSILTLAGLAAYAKEALAILTGSADSPPALARVEELAKQGGADQALFERVRKICGGSHPATPILTRVRNKLVFHWDPSVVRDSLQEFSRNKELVWAEAADKTSGSTVYRLSVEVLVHALLHTPATDSSGQHDVDELSSNERVREAMDPVIDAVTAIVRLFECAMLGFFVRAGVEPRAQ
jgi:hypothetical protein